MRKISNFKDDTLRDDQFNVLIDILGSVKNKNDLGNFFRTFMTKSELAYIGQRLNIMRMLLKKFSYQEIADKLNVPPNTIYRVCARLEFGGDQLKKIISQYKYKPQKHTASYSSGNGFVRATYPGAIKGIRGQKKR